MNFLCLDEADLDAQLDNMESSQTAEEESKGADADGEQQEMDEDVQQENMEVDEETDKQQTEEVRCFSSAFVYECTMFMDVLFVLLSLLLMIEANCTL